MFGRNLPSSGGGYFRLLPYALSRWMIAPRQPASTASRRSSTSTPGRSTRRSRASPGIDAKTRFRHYVNLHRMERAAAAACCATSAGGAWTASSCAREPRRSRAAAAAASAARADASQRLDRRRRADRRALGRLRRRPARRPPSSTAPAGSA
ncbi:MAG: hypothetical protein MZW92_21230 [Comamonadaceae bacterium]|nr:hypothetical protein [Comamonadaceae bacterium]